jgi:hypothetical protein
MEEKPKAQGFWLYCKRCKKKLAKKYPNGMFCFEFGKKRGDENAKPRVHIEIDGDFKIRCLNTECTADNIFTQFPRPSPPTK